MQPQRAWVPCCLPQMGSWALDSGRSPGRDPGPVRAWCRDSPPRPFPALGEGLVDQMALCPPGGRHPGGCRQVLHPAIEEAALGTGASLGGAQPHLIHRPTPGAPTVPGTAPGRGRGLWAGTALGEGPALLMPGAVQNSRAPRAAFVSMQGVPAHGAGRGAHGCALRLSALWTCRPPASEQPFTVYKAHSWTWALEPWALGQRLLRVPTLQMGTQRPKDEKCPLQACARTPGHSQGGSRPCCPQACSCLPQAVSAASTVGSWAFLTILGRCCAPVCPQWGSGETRGRNRHAVAAFRALC